MDSDIELDYRHEEELKEKISDYETIIGMFSKALDELVHAYEDGRDYDGFHERMEASCEKAKELLPFYKRTTYEDED